jgi:hypothetical protein
MTQEQAAVLQSVQEEYWQYLERLEERSKSDIINESGRTQFYADMVLYLEEHAITEKQIDALDTPDILNKLYTEYLSNGLDNTSRADIGGKVIFGFVKRQRGSAM